MRSRILYVSADRNRAGQFDSMVHDLPLLFDHAEDLRQASACLFQNHYDAVVTEALLPDGNWLDVLHLVRRCPLQLQVILSVPHADASWRSNALKLGVCDLVLQPFQESEVRGVISRACGGEAHRAYEVASA